MNLTAVSLSLLTLYSTSPLFTGNKLVIRESVFKYSISTLFYNPKTVKLQKNNFINSISPVLYLSNSKTLLYREAFEYSDSIFSYPDNIVHSEKNCSVIIHDCSFVNYSVSSSSIIKVSHATFYMTSCTFINCVADYDPILKLNSRATTITHVCCTFLEKEVSQDTNLFIESEVAENSFFQLIYSSFKGVNTDSYIRSNSMFLFQGRGSLRYQCVNLSECDLSKALTSIAPLSLIFQMNTFYKINTNIILYLNIQGGSDYYYANLNYVGSTNFIYDSVDGEVVFLDMHVGTNITFDNCVFYLVPSSYSNNIAFRCENPEVIPLVINCFFDEDIVIAFGNGGVNLVNKSVLNYPYFLDLAHYVVPGICDGEQKPNAYGCNNNECPSHVICIPDAFSFHPNDYTYTLILDRKSVV